MAKPRLNHMVVILPGITGSVLQKDGRDLWAFSGQAVYDAAFHRKDYLDSLKIHGTDTGDLDDLGDGIRATRLMRNATLVPGLIKLFDGYNGLGQVIRGRFEIVGSGGESSDPSNLFEFPYDWRRHNRAAGRKLGRLVEERLAQWRKFTFNQGAKVILLAHSMGGLVARYYLEVLEGWKDCLALVTFGTPYRGSLNSLNFLANGYKQTVVDLSDCLRSFPSVYQLLPTYAAVRTGSGFRTIADCGGIQLVDPARVAAAAAFHVEIASKVEEHRNDTAYVSSGYKILPFVGTRQPTLQSSVLEGTAIQASAALPDEVHELLDGGDGTVPRYSAVPPELSGEFRETFVPEKHGSLQACAIVLNDLLGRLEQMQVPKPVRGPEVATEGSAIALNLEDLYLKHEPVRVRATIVNPGADFGEVVAFLRPADGVVSPARFKLAPSAETWEAVLPELGAGLYQIEVKTTAPYPIGPPPVHDVFQVEG